MALDRVYLSRVGIFCVEGYMRKFFGAILLAVLVFTAAMGLKGLTSSTARAGMFANLPGPVPPQLVANLPGPVPPQASR